jgi:hypothetical protein
MRTQRVFFLLAVVLVVTACASAPPRPIRSEFEDIPLPKGMSLVEDRSTVIESATVKAARLLYRGAIEQESLAVSMRTTLEANGWRHVSTTRAGDRGTVQVYEKGGSSVELRYWDGFYWRPVTYLEVTTSRALQSQR